MSKQKKPEMPSCPVEKMPYVMPFKLKPDDHRTFILLDYHEQSITDLGELCRDKPIKARSNTGVTELINWGTKVFPTNQPIPQEDSNVQE